MGDWWGDAADFFQRECFTCAAACVRFMLHLDGLDYAEEELRSLLCPYLSEGMCERDGYSDVEVARALFYQFRRQPRLRCLTGQEARFEGIPNPWISPGTAKELLPWLRSMVEQKRPVKVCVEAMLLNGGQGVVSCPHSIVVVAIDKDAVRYLEPDPPNGQEQGRGIIDQRSLGVFRAAWEEFGYLALTLDPVAMP